MAVSSESGKPQRTIQFRFVAGRHQHHARHRAEERLVAEAVVHGAVVADEAGAVHAEARRAGRSARLPARPGRTRAG